MPVVQVTDNVEFYRNAQRMPSWECHLGGSILVQGRQVMVH
jgi:hypothetical protein